MRVLLGSTIAGNIRVNTSNGTMTSTIVQSDIGNSVNVFGAQLETGSVATSYIPTTTAAATRNAEVISLSGAVSGCIGQTEGTMYAEVDMRNFAAGFNRVLAISDGTEQNAVRIFTNSNAFILQVQVSNVQQVSISIGSLPVGIYKIAVAYKLNDTAMFMNGVQVGVTDTSCLVPTCSQVFIGKFETTSVSQILNDRIRAVALYTTRLTNPELAALTT
jgi:hypothetical protein